MITICCKNDSDYIEAISLLINQQKDMVVIGKTDTKSSPDLLLLDIDEFTLNEAVSEVKKAQEEYRASKVVVFTSNNKDDPFLVLIEAGADSILPKKNKRKAIQSLRKTAGGESIIPAHLALKVADRVAQLQASVSREFAAKLEAKNIRLTQKEIDIAYLMRSGLKNNEIAERLNLKPGTIKVYVSHIYRKIGMKRRKQVMELLKTIYPTTG